MSHEALLHPILVSSFSFAPFGQVIAPSDDGLPFGPADAQLVLTNGTPRLYIMRLKSRGLAFDKITRHVRVTQCLVAVGGGEWLLAVAPPLRPDDPSAMPDPASIQAFRISGSVGIKLHRGTWHAGPFFTAPTMDFLNLELADTNENDHADCHLARDHGVSFHFV